MTSWTPALGHCLEPGGRYAWSVRAWAEDTAGEWSEPRLFGVSRGDVGEALEILKRHFGDNEILADLAELPERRRDGSSAPSPVARPQTDDTRAGDDGSTRRVQQSVATSIAEIGLGTRVRAYNSSVQGNVAGVRAEFLSRDTFDRALGYLGVSTPSGTGFDGFGQLDLLAGANIGVLGFAPPSTFTTIGVVGAAGGNEVGGYFLNADANGDVNSLVQLATETYGIRVEGGINTFHGQSLFVGRLAIPLGHLLTLNSGADAVPEVYQINDALAPTCNRGDIAVMRPSGAGNQDGLCFCGLIGSNLQWWCFNP